MKRALTIAAFVALAALAAYNTYRVAAIDAWLSAEIATRIDEHGRTQPLNRADALAYFLREDIVAFKAAEAK